MARGPMTGAQPPTRGGSAGRSPTRGTHDDHRPDVLPEPRRGDRRPDRATRLRRRVRPGGRGPGRARRARRRRGLRRLRHRRRLGRPADVGRRTAPLRLERLLQRADARGPRHGRGRAAAPLPAPAGAAQLAHPRLRHPARPALPPAAQDRGGGGAGGARRLLAAAHPALRSRRGLPDLPGWRRRERGPGRHRAARPQHLRRPPRLGDRPRDRSTSPTTPGGTSTRTCSSPASGGRRR